MDLPYWAGGAAQGESLIWFQKKRREKASIIDHSLPSQVHVVNRWPGDAKSSKIPSLILYDSRRVAKSFGAEALLEDVQVQANEEG
ncbi:hypothetical protein JCM1841_004634 [Sporobolomyces salmonicolor]